MRGVKSRREILRGGQEMRFGNCQDPGQRWCLH